MFIFVELLCMARKKQLVWVGPRRRRRKLTIAQKIIWGGLAVVAIYCAFAVIQKAVRPVKLLCAGKAEVSKMEEKFAKDKAENKALREKRKYLLTPSGAEAEARKLGYVRPGEVSVIIEDNKSEDKDSKK